MVEAKQISLRELSKSIEQGGNPLRVLEIGVGNKAAINSGGEIFGNSNLYYIGLDLPNSFTEYETSRRQAREINDREDSSLVAADTASLPFPDNSFDVILMRSMFGQFRDHPGLWHTSRRNVEFGLYEAFRVLKPGGKIVVAEENTPEDWDVVERDLRYAGFKPLEFASMKTLFKDIKPDDEWMKLRSLFFNDRPTQPWPDRMLGTPYILIAQKPEQPEYEIFKSELAVRSKDNAKSKRVKDHKSKFRNVVYKKGKDKFPGITP